MTDHDMQLLIDGAILGELVILAAWWVFGRRDRQAARQASERALAESEAAIARVRAVKKAPGRSAVNRYANAQDDGWDQALAEVRAALAVEVGGVDESAAEPARLVRPVMEQPVGDPQQADDSSAGTCQVVRFGGEPEADR